VKDVLENPVILPFCGHFYCYDCIMEWVWKHSPPTCPECRELFNESEMKEPDLGVTGYPKGLFFTTKIFLTQIFLYFLTQFV